MRIKSFVFLMAGLLIVNLFVHCGSGTDVVDSGEYTGIIKKVVADEQEIYVTTEEGQTLELYFTEETQLTRQGQPVDFSQLKKDQNVSVTLIRVGNRLDPDSVAILE
ncbi:MAG: hypothetical protein U5R06_23215 [candidate division KSB1 bacterium]|nr:hypothetical protein [candidate division KSB1 bacterium]